MTNNNIYVTGIGIVSSIGDNVDELTESLLHKKRGITPLSIFQTQSEKKLPVGQVPEFASPDHVPRTHSMALKAALDAVKNKLPEAIIVGTTTGGMPLSENLLKKGDNDSSHYSFHSTGSVVEYLSDKLNCNGPVIAISTACSSGTAAVKLAVEMIKQGKVKKVLVGGADALCRLTYFGFNSLQLIDPDGARPFDKDRKGMSVAEGAAFLMLESFEEKPEDALAEVLGGGLSCDAHHAAAPHPDGEGAITAIENALRDSGIEADIVDYINLHGTGTRDNDLSESKALKYIFKNRMPYISSTKGATGHTLGAAGALESIISIISLKENFIPANIGCECPDSELNVEPVVEPIKEDVNIVLSNSFGFGGNNASVIFSKPGIIKKKEYNKKTTPLSVLGISCFTGAGDLKETMARIKNRKKCTGLLDQTEISKKFSPREVRRLKRLPRLVLSLSIDAHEQSGLEKDPHSIYFGTGWGALTETNDFLSKLFETDEQFVSPTDFVGSVHNAPAGQAAIKFNSKGPNITTTGGDYSFEQALLSASLLSEENDETMLIVGADEYHEKLSNIFDPSVENSEVKSDGGGALILKYEEEPSGITIEPVFYERWENNPNVMDKLLEHLGGIESINERFGAVFVGIPGAYREISESQIKNFMQKGNFQQPFINYRKIIGQFPTASSTAAVLAVETIKGNFDGIFEIDEFLISKSGNQHDLKGKGILLLGLGIYITAIEIL